MIAETFNQYNSKIQEKLLALEQTLNSYTAIKYYGRVVSATGSIIIATLPLVKIGDLCVIEDKNIGLKLYAEVVALNGEEVKLLPFGSIENLSNLADIYCVSNNFMISISDNHLGKIVNGLGVIMGNLTDSIDMNLNPKLEKTAILEEDIIENSVDNELSQKFSVMRLAPDPLTRSIIEEVLYTGVRAIDQFMTCGRGQRVAILAGPGMGKTTLMGMIIKYAKADVFVIALVGERGREVREFIDLELNAESRKKCVLVVVTSDRPPVEQVKAAFVAQTIAEYFRDQGKNVVMFVDSITRFARAQREVGLSAGEPITRGGFPPSVFLSFPRLMERAGNNELGSITAFYTVLMENEKTNQDPIADEIKSIVDGHIVLDLSLVEKSHFPAINILTSLSRVADRIISDEHKQAARKIRALLSKHKELEFLLRVGEYKRGNDDLADEAIDKYQQIMQYLRQDVHEKTDFNSDLNQLIEIAAKSSLNNNIMRHDFDFDDDDDL